MKPRERESTFERIDRARKILDLPERASMRQIRDNYHELSRRWHPDLCRENESLAREKQQEINDAYRTLMDYCTGYVYSLRKEDVQEFQESEDFWWEHFGEF